MNDLNVRFTSVQISRMRKKIQPTGFWTFFCNPSHWPIDNYLPKWKEGHKSRYMITSWQRNWFKSGDVGIIRVGHDQRSVAELNGKERLQRGIYALVEVVDLPVQETDFRKKKKGQIRYYVDIKYLRNYIKKPILLTELKEVPIVKQDPYLIPGYQASSMPLKEEVFNLILLWGEERSLE